jgi:hypothetical protein
MSEIIHVAFKQNHAAEDELITAVKDAVYSFHGRVTTASVFGALEIIKQDLIRELMS